MQKLSFDTQIFTPNPSVLSRDVVITNELHSGSFRIHSVITKDIICLHIFIGLLTCDT